MNSLEKNQPNYLSVTALTQYLKRKFEVDPYLQKVLVIGEISNYNPKATKHRYFSLKDAKAKISVVMFQSAFEKLKFVPEEGMKVIVQGRVDLYPASGAYQIIIDQMQPDGVGALYQAFEQLKNKLQMEGLFDLPKKPLVKFPKRIAVITSPSGAVIRDILTTIQRRYPICQVVVFPTKVQGLEASKEIVNAFRMIEEQKENFDTIILARGGGSIEDLWSFNEEVVARAIVASSLPVISSIGHETDTTIADYVADLRAATPTAAAEQAVPNLVEIFQQIHQYENRMTQAIHNQLRHYRKDLEKLQQSYTLQDPQRLYLPYSQRLDELQQFIFSNIKLILNHKKIEMIQWDQRLMLKSPDNDVKLYQRQVTQWQQELERSSTRYIHDLGKKLMNQVQLLDALSPLKILARGYAVVEKDKQIIKSVDEIAVGEKLSVRFNDGHAITTVTQIEKKRQEEANDEI